MKLRKYYSNAVIYPSIVVVVLSIGFSVVEKIDYKSEWITAESVILASVITAIIYSILISGLSLTIFLNKYKSVGENLMWSALAWFLLPFGFIIITFFYAIHHRIKYEAGFGVDFIYILILTVPYVLALSWTFIGYVKRNVPTNRA